MTNTNTVGISAAKSQDRTTLFKLSDLLIDLRADADAAYNAKQSGKPRGPITGLSKLDAALGTYLCPGLHILQAAPGAGKTAMALQVTSDSQFPALYVSAEMSTLELFRRLISRQTKTFLGKLKDGSLLGNQIEQLAIDTVKKLPHLAIMDATRAFADPDIIRDTAHAMREQAGADHCLVVVDSLHVWARSSRQLLGASINEYDLLNQSLESASAIAADLKCPVVLVSHRNRQGQSNGGLHAAKGTGDIEYLAESVIDLERDSKAIANASGEIEVKAKMQKNRNGIPGIEINLNFLGRLQSFTEQ